MVTRIAVTGAGGFIGRHVLDALSAAGGSEVIAVTRSGWQGELPHGVRHMRMDLSMPSPDAWQMLDRPDVLVHLAWGGLPNYSSHHHFESELPVHYRFLKGLVEQGLPALLCAGTCFEYGMREGMLHESQQPQPHNCYAFAKDALRRQLGFLREQHAFALTWARLFYTYGPGQPAGSLYGQFQAAVVRGEREFPMSGGEQLRDYLPVQEVARLVGALALSKADAGIVNVCAGGPTSVRKLVEGWAREQNWPGALALGRYPYPRHEPMAFWGSDAKLRRVLEAAA
ncbi:NAD(P)-dependent oxidoreductase [Luteibacter sp.]|uniref:NAD-dependent epimerase/dehydratase family protein n=1 Tax=Luteibacter sp. TaxID=1886636 RepID=UPI002809A909|nr:NAD(P)-dependent oxidoreductase [Luteibacter sp.]MDQ8050659.1 NAD(P)-dependent oxidoreductase [Luteibacter sp.]